MQVCNSTQHDVCPIMWRQCVFVRGKCFFVYFAIIGAAVGAYAERFIAALIGPCLKARLTQTAFWCGARWVQRKSAHAPCVCCEDSETITRGGRRRKRKRWLHCFSNARRLLAAQTPFRRAPHAASTNNYINSFFVSRSVGATHKYMFAILKYPSRALNLNELSTHENGIYYTYLLA